MRKPRSSAAISFLLSRRSLAPAVGAALFIAACGATKSPGSGSGTSASKRAAFSASSAALSTTSVPGYGKVLATRRGSPLYVLTSDPSGGSSCNGSCAKQWPPLTVSGKPAAGAGVNAALLSSFRRADGTRQVLYAERALYTHPGASATSVAGTAADGGIWYLVSPSGKPVTKTAGSGY